MSISLLLAACLTLSPGQSAPGEPELKELLATLAQAPTDAREVATQARHYRRAWQLIEALPLERRPTWRNTTAAVLGLPLSALREGERRSRAEADPEAAIPLDRVIGYYRALLEATPADAPEALKHDFRTALAAALLKQAHQHDPAERGPFLEEARGLDRAAADFWRKTANLPAAAQALHRLGFGYFVQSREEEAEPFWQDAIRLYEKLPQSFLATADLGLDKPLANRLNEWSHKGYEDQAADYLLLGLTRYNEGLEDPAQARESVYLWAEALRIGMAHRNVTAINNVGALLIRPSIGEETGRARKIYSLQGVIEALPDAASNPHWRGRDGLTDIDQALHWMLARAHEYLGRVYSESGQTLLARHHLNRAERHAADLDDAAILPLVRESQARLWGRIGQVDEALRCCREVLDSKPSLRQRSDVICLMGRLFEQEEDFARAMDCYRWALDLFVKPGSFTLRREDVGAVARIRAEVGRMELERGNVAVALNALREAASMAALEDAEQAAQYDIEQLRLVRWASDPGRYRPSPTLSQALERSREDPIVDRAVRGLKLEAQGRPPAASPEDATLSRGQALLLRDRLHPRPPADLGEARLEVDLHLAQLEARLGHRSLLSREVSAWRAASKGELERAAELWREVLDIQWKAAERDLNPELAIEAPEDMRRAHHEAAALEIRLGRPVEALRILDALRDRALLRVVSSGVNLWDRLTPEERVEAARLDDERTRRSQRVLELTQQLTKVPEGAELLRRERARLLEAEAAWHTFKARLRSAHPTPAAERRPLEVDQIPTLLGEGEGLLLFAVGPYQTCAVLVHRVHGKVQYTARLLAVRQAELETLAAAFREGCARPDGSYELLGRELYGLLIAPFAEQIARLRLLAIAADGPLNTLPFAALQDGKGKHLLERLPLASVTSLALHQRLKAAPRPPREGVLVVDVQSFREAFWIPAAYRGQLDPKALTTLVPQIRLPDLSGTRTEGDELARLFGTQAERLRDRAAREEVVKRAAGGKRYLHFATHGLADLYNPFHSALVLARPGEGSRADGFLEAREILASKEFSGAELVTLSACESGLGLVQGSEGVLGLGWVFLAAGNRAVLVSLWSVHDAPTAELMAGFYRALLAGQDKATALRQAALALRSNRATAHPAYWAPFLLLGDWSQ